ncbi:MAG TPA: biotin--[acetyl-CoA-carboxylase] ligase [Solirubrobacteraceae bacterium]
MEKRTLGTPRVHLRCTDSTNERARELAIGDVPHGTLVTTEEQTAGRGRQGRAWCAPPRSALLCSLVLRDPPALLSLIAGVAVCDAVGPDARVKWPNDVVLESPTSPKIRTPEPARPTAPTLAERRLAKVAGILVEGRPQEGWAVLGIGVNVAVRVEELPEEVSPGAASLERPASAIEPLLAHLLVALTQRCGESSESVLAAWRARDALFGREISWNVHGAEGGMEHGRSEGIDSDGRLLVRQADGGTTALRAGEVHLASAG